MANRPNISIFAGLKQTAMQLLNELCKIHAPSGSELRMKDFLLTYITKHQDEWKKKPRIIQGEDFQDCFLLIFGKPRTAVFAHMDSIGFTVRYQDQLIPIGGPEIVPGYPLTGEDRLGPIECKLLADDEHQLTYQFGRGIERGTTLVYKCDFRETTDHVQSCCLDNRLGIYNALKLAETLEDGVIVFSCWEEHGGGSVGYLTRYVYEKLQVRQALISDITWVTDGIRPGRGVAISMRDQHIPRKSFVDHIIKIAAESGIDHQLEVEASGSSDGGSIQVSPYPLDWCFIGAPEDNVHSPHEIVHKRDIESMLSLYRELMYSL